MFGSRFPQFATLAVAIVFFAIRPAVASSSPNPAPASPQQDFFDRGVLRTLEIEFVESDWHDILKQNKKAGLQVFLAGDLTIDGVLYPNVGVRYKGNSSYWNTRSGEKKPLNIDLKAFGVDQEVMGVSKVVLNNQYVDASLMREVIAYRVLNQFSPASRANFVKVLINGDNYGIYTNVEHIGGPFTERWFGDSGGFRYKAVPPWGWPDTLTTPPPPADIALQEILGLVGRAAIAYDLKNRELDPLHHLDILAAIDVLNQTQSDLLVDALEPYFDTDNAVRHLALNNAVGSLDAYYSTGQNYYLYHDPRNDRLTILPWDYNMAFGNYGPASWDMSPTLGKSEAARPLLSKLVKGGVLRQEYLAHLANITDRGLNPAQLTAEIRALEALIDAEVQIDTRLGVDYNGWKNGINSLINYITKRHDFLASHALLAVERPTFLNFGHSPLKPNSADPVHFWARAENPNDPVKSIALRYRVSGAFLLLDLWDDGMHGDGAAGDGLYGADLPAFNFGDQVQYYFQARTTNSNGLSFAPDSASFTPLSFTVLPSASASDVLLNEFVARNNSGPTDEAGEFEDWIELHNHGAATVDLSGMWLTDDLAVAQKWAIPAGTLLDPNQTLLIWADNEPLDGPMHTTFKLSFGGEDLALFAVDGVTLLDFMSFGLQEADVATARLHDGSDLWVTTPDTTPAASNNQTCGVRAYDALDSARNVATFEVFGTPSPGTTVQLRVSGFAVGQTLLMYLGSKPVALDDQVSGLSMMVGEIFNQFPMTADITGRAQIDLPIPPNTGLVGMSFYLQAGTRGLAPIATHGIEAVICP
jgi:CotH protein/lamin tail-like protein